MSQTIEEPLSASKKRILVMDDKEMVRITLKEMLVYLGYDVELAKDGAEAIAKYQIELDANRPIDAAILDISVQVGMGGKETFQLLRQIDPNVKAIISSGYTDDPLLVDYQSYGLAGMIIKPYSLKDLRRTLEAVIHGE
jgi:CheY-like chemotaxis protein